MPELAEVEITRQKLLPAVRGRRILGFWTDWPRRLKFTTPLAARRDMTGRRILDIARRGKALFFKLSGKSPRMLAIHLGMSGRLEVTHSSASAKRERLRMRHPEPRARSGRGISLIPLKAGRGILMSSPEKWTHFQWFLSNGKILQFVDPRKFGLVWYGSSGDFSRDPYLGRLGQDANKLKAKQFLGILRQGRGMIKPFLLRQDKFAGIGNIIVDESLWRAKIHPETRITYLDEQSRRRLRNEIQKTIRAMLSSGGTTLRNWIPPGGQAGNFQERRSIHGRAGQSCLRCRKKLKRIVVSGRGTTVCLQCQKIVRHSFDK